MKLLEEFQFLKGYFQISLRDKIFETCTTRFLAVHPWLKSTHLIENFISLLREFGFLHFCSDLFFQDKSGYGLYAVPDLDVLSDRSRFHWWRGYSPYDVDHSDQGWPLPAKDSLKNVKKTRKKVLLL